MNLRTYFSEQARNPTGVFGRVVMSRIFNLGNAALNDFMKSQLELTEYNHVLDIGCGTGKFLHEISNCINTGKFEGVDISAAMVKIAERMNRKSIIKGDVLITHGDFEKIDYIEHSFDAVCSANTIYFWPDPRRVMEKIYRILKPGGRLFVAFEDKKRIEKRPLDFEIFRTYSEQEVANLMTLSGFSKTGIASMENRSGKIHCCTAEK